MAKASPDGAPRATRAAVAAASYVPSPPGVTATVWAAIVAAVTATACQAESGKPAARAISQTTAPWRPQARTVAPGAPKVGRRTAEPSSRSRRDQTRPAVATAPAAPDTSRAQAPAAKSTAGAAIAASAKTASTSAARRVSADAVTAWAASDVRRSTLVTRSGSPRRSGSTWLPSSETCTAAHAWRAGSPGSVRCQAQDRNTKAPAYAVIARVSPSGSAATAKTTRRTVPVSMAPARYTAAATTA